MNGDVTKQVNARTQTWSEKSMKRDVAGEKERDELARRKRYMSDLAGVTLDVYIHIY